MLGNDSIIFNLSNSCVKTYTKCVNTNEKSNVLPYSVNIVLNVCKGYWVIFVLILVKYPICPVCIK